MTTATPHNSQRITHRRSHRACHQHLHSIYHWIWQNTYCHYQNSSNTHAQQHKERLLMSLVYNMTSSSAQESGSVKAGETAQGCSTSQTQQNKGQHHQKSQFRRTCLLSQSNKALQHQPLPYKTAGKRQRGQCHSTYQGEKCRIWHFLQKATHFFYIFAASSMHNCTSTHKHQALHQAVTKGVNSSSRKGYNSQRHQMHRHKQHTTAKGTKNNAHILYRGIGQNSFHIHFHSGIEHSQKSRQQAYNHDNQAIPDIVHTNKLESKTTKTIESHL